MAIKIEHLAFMEGRLAYREGRATTQNPFSIGDDNSPPYDRWDRWAFDSWLMGWKSQEDEYATATKAARQLRMGYED